MTAITTSEIQRILTMLADEFGGDVPVGQFALIGGDAIGRGIVDTLTGSRSPAVLTGGHGPFTIGPRPRDAVQAAVMLEDIARTVRITLRAGPVARLEQADIDQPHHRYQSIYGQKATPR
jgi:L-ribulose-5-phosphate 4-epimerase